MDWNRIKKRVVTVPLQDVSREWFPTPPPPPAVQSELDYMRARIVQVFDIPMQLLGVTYDGEFIPTGPVVESTIEKEKQ